MARVEPRGIYSYADQSEAFNTAALNGNALNIPIHSYLVKSWFRAGDTDISDSVACSLSNPSANAFTVFTDSSNCVISISSTNTEGLETEGVTVKYQGEEATVSTDQPLDSVSLHV